MVKSGEGILTNNTPENYSLEDNDPKVFTVFETFASNNMRKRTLCGLAKVYQVAIINPWSDTAITLNASDEPKSRTARALAALVLSPIVDGFRLTKVLMDGSSGLNLIYEETLQKMEIDRNRIEQCSTTESTSAPWVVFVINVNISLVGLTLLPSMFQISSTMEWHG